MHVDLLRATVGLSVKRQFAVRLGETVRNGPRVHATEEPMRGFNTLAFYLLCKSSFDPPPRFRNAPFQLSNIRRISGGRNPTLVLPMRERNDLLSRRTHIRRRRLVFVELIPASVVMAVRGSPLRSPVPSGVFPRSARMYQCSTVSGCVSWFNNTHLRLVPCAPNYVRS